MKFSPTHEWVQVDGHIGTVGISNHAQKEIGAIVYVQLPIIGKTITTGQEAAVLESTKAAADIYSPVSGTILAVNDKLIQDSGLINRSAEDEGWLFKIELSDLKELDALMDLEKYQRL
jgi:glycine cleavage system H protein